MTDNIVDLINEIRDCQRCELCLKHHKRIEELNEDPIIQP